jgi:hypothetical protein
MWIPHFNYISLCVLIASVTFFVRAARFDQRSELVWGLSSFGSWMVFTTFVSPGIWGGIASQVLLFIGITVFDYAREQRQHARRHEDA